MARIKQTEELDVQGYVMVVTHEQTQDALVVRSAGTQFVKHATVTVTEGKG